MVKLKKLMDDLILAIIKSDKFNDREKLEQINLCINLIVKETASEIRKQLRGES